MENQNAFDLVLQNCRTIHKFANTPVDARIIERALENSLLAPNHKFTFPWKFYWAGRETKARLIELAATIKFSNKASNKDSIRELEYENISNEEKINLANKFNHPEVIVFTQKRSDDAFTAKEDYASLSCAVQLFALSLASCGLGYKWSTGKITRHPSTYEILNISSEDEEIIGFISAGHAARDPGPRKRPKLSEVLVKTI